MKTFTLYFFLLLPLAAIAELPCDPQPITEVGTIRQIDLLGHKFSAPLTSSITFDTNLHGMNIMFWIDMNEIRNIQKKVVDSSIPDSNCRHRYHNNHDYTLNVVGDTLRGSSTVRYQKWICETVKYPCVVHWKPKMCEKEAKTKVFTHVEHLNFILSPTFDSVSDSIEIVIAGKTHGKYTFNVTDYVKPELYKNIKNYMKMNHTGFRVNESGRIGLTVIANSKELRPNTTCSIYERLKNSKSNKSALRPTELDLTSMAVEAVK